MTNHKNLKFKTYQINKKIYEKELSVLNFGNASIIDRLKGRIYIKASGIDVESCKFSNIVEVKINNFKPKKYLKLKPSVDTVIHIELYKYLKNINCIIHTHSEFSTILSQANIEPECFGTTHADYFSGSIPISDRINKVDKKNYEYQIAKSIIKKLKRKRQYLPGILLRDHGVFAWGKNEKEALDNLMAIEYICKLYFKTKMMIKKPKISKSLRNFHFLRKNGKNKYYGQFD